MWGIRWPIVQRMLADQPVYDNKSKESETERLMEKINSIKRG